VGRRQPVGLDRHPGLEFARQAGKRFFRARDRIVEIVEILFGDTPQHLAQRVGLRDHVVIGEGLDLDVALVDRHDGFPGASPLDAGAGLVEQRRLLQHFHLAADAAFGADIGIAGVAPAVRAEIGLGLDERRGLATTLRMR